MILRNLYTKLSESLYLMSARTRQRLLVVVLLLTPVIGIYFALCTWKISTDDAFIAGRILTISPKIDGHIVKLFVDDNQAVKAGDIVAVIDPRDAQARLDALQATLAAEQANQLQAQNDLNRANTQRSISMSEQGREQAATRLKVAEAEVKKTLAQIDLAKLDLEHTNLVAPFDGRIAKRAIELNSYVEHGQAVMALVSKDFWVVANFKESQLKNIRPGQKTYVTIDAFPGVELEAKVDSIQSGTGGSFSAFPAENATGNFVKVVQRVPVKITFTSPPPPDIHLAIGMSVIPTVDTRPQ